MLSVGPLFMILLPRALAVYLSLTFAKNNLSFKQRMGANESRIFHSRRISEFGAVVECAVNLLSQMRYDLSSSFLRRAGPAITLRLQLQ
jgi:hypothetical protein